MSIPANVSATGVFQVADWTPPPIETLDFTTDCDLVHGFYRSWFQGLLELGPGEDKLAVFQLPFSNKKSSFFIASSVNANATEAYFRNALPLELRDVPSYGQILDWEFALRTDFARALPKLAELTRPPDAGPIDWFLNGTYQAPYFTRVIRDPGITCQAQACSSFSWDSLIDINGPGVYYVYWIQVATMLLASILVVSELWMTRSRKPRSQRYGPKIGSAYRCFRRMVEAMIQGASYFFAVVPLALFVDYMAKGPHFFPPSDQNTALLIACLSFMMLLWAWRMNRCFAAIDLVKGFSPVSSGLGHLPLFCLVVAIPWLVFLLAMRSRSWASAAEYIDAFDFDAFSFVICRGVASTLARAETTKRRANTNNLFIISRLACTFLAYFGARVLWDDLTVRSTVERFLPWGQSKEFTAALHDAVLTATSQRSGEALDEKELDRVTFALHDDPRASAHIWHLGYGEMIGLSAACLYTLIEYAPWRKVEVEWTQVGEQWGLGQILSIFTLAPVVVEVIMSAQWSSDGSQNVTKEGETNVLRYLRNHKRRVVVRHLLARQGA